MMLLNDDLELLQNVSDRLGELTVMRLHQYGFENRRITDYLPWPLVLLGPAGLGKSSAALCLLDVAGGWYFEMSELCEIFIHAQQRAIEMTTRSLWERLEKTSLVVVDDMGAREKVSDHHYEIAKRLLDKRENHPLVCISNHNLERLSQLYDDRLASRLAYGTVLTIAGKDRRLLNN